MGYGRKAAEDISGGLAMHDTKFLAVRRREFLALGSACALTSGLWHSPLAAAESLQRANVLGLHAHRSVAGQ